MSSVGSTSSTANGLGSPILAERRKHNQSVGEHSAAAVDKRVAGGTPQVVEAAAAAPGAQSALASPGGYSHRDALQFLQRSWTFNMEPSGNNDAILENFTRKACEQDASTNTVDAILAKSRDPHRLDDFGTAPTAGTFALQTVGFVGVVQAAYLLIMGPLVFKRNRRLAKHLEQQAGDLERYHSDLTRALDKAPEPRKEVIRRELAAVAAHHLNVAQAQRHAALNMSLSGGLRMLAAGSIMSLGIDRAPTLVGAATLLPPTVGSVLGVVGGGLLAIFGLAWFVRNTKGAIRAWRTPLHDPAVASDTPELAEYIAQCNLHTRRRRAYHTINAVSALAYVGAAITMAGASDGLALVPLAVLPFLATASATSLASELSWGRQMMPHNAQTPHLDRLALRDMGQRMILLRTLVEQRRLQRATRRKIVQSLPRHHRRLGFSLNPQRLWLRIPKQRRNWVWRLLPGGQRRLGAWCARDKERVDPIMHRYLCDYNSLEIAYQEHRVANLRQQLLPGADKMREEEDEEVLDFMRRIASGYEFEANRLVAMKALQQKLQNLNVAQLRTDPDALAAWNDLRIKFLTLHRLDYHFFTSRHLKKHPDWFNFGKEGGGESDKPVEGQVRITYDGLTRAAQAFDHDMEVRFANLMLNSTVQDYEIHAVRGLDEEARRSRNDEVQRELATLAGAEKARKRD